MYRSSGLGAFIDYVKTATLSHWGGSDLSYTQAHSQIYCTVTKEQVICPDETSVFKKKQKETQEEVLMILNGLMRITNTAGH